MVDKLAGLILLFQQKIPNISRETLAKAFFGSDFSKSLVGGQSDFLTSKVIVPRETSPEESPVQVD
jgi:hypothetical protein